MTRRTRIRALIERAGAPSRRFATCDVHVHSNTQTRTRGSECTLIRTQTRTHVTVVYYRTVQCDLAGYYRPWDPRRPEIGPNMAQSHEDRKRSRRECGSCGHPDRRLFATRAVRVAYGYARPPLLPPDPPRHRPDPPGPPPGGQGGRLEVGPEVNRGEYRHKGGRLIAAEAAAAADGYARGALSAPEPARGRQRSAAPWGGGSRGSSKEPAKVNREDHRHEGGS